MLRKRVLSQILYQTNRYCSAASKIPKRPTWIPIAKEDLPEPPVISEELVKYLERTSLVCFSNEDGIRQLHEFINFANQMRHVDVTGVEPLHSLQENEILHLREDEVTEGNCRDVLLSLATKTVEDLYFVAPPGNVPLDQSTERIDGKP